MGGQRPVMVGECAPGDERAIMVSLVAPMEPGTHMGTWRMRCAGVHLMVMLVLVLVLVPLMLISLTPLQGYFSEAIWAQVLEDSCC